MNTDGPLRPWRGSMWTREAKSKRGCYSTWPLQKFDKRVPHTVLRFGRILSGFEIEQQEGDQETMEGMDLAAVQIRWI